MSRDYESRFGARPPMSRTRLVLTVLVVFLLPALPLVFALMRIAHSSD